MTFSIKTIARALAISLLTLPLFGGLAPLCAHEYKAGELLIDHPWARATPGRARNGAAFVTLVNHGGAPDRLMSASGDVADRVELHTHIHENGVMKMRPSGPVEIPPHGEAKLEPGSYHIMMIGLKAPLIEGESFPLTLTFEKAGPVEVVVKIMSVGAGAGMSKDMKGHDMKGHNMNQGDMKQGGGMKMSN